MKILIVDDSMPTRELHKIFLKQAGFSQLQCAVSGLEALELLGIEDTTPEGPVDIDLILMDIEMPQMDGIEACRLIKANERLKDVPIIMVTSRTEFEYLKAAFDAGAMDYITKEKAKIELPIRARSALALKQEMDLRKRRENEIAEIGARIQDTMLFSDAPEDVPTLQIAAMTIPSLKIDGDFYDFIRPDEQCVDILIGDVMGKGVSAALLGAATKTQFFRSIQRLFLSSKQNQKPRPEDIIMAVHEEVSKKLYSLDTFITLCYARLNTTSKQLQLVDCGHTATIHYHHAENRISKIKGENTALGLYKDEIYKETILPVDKKDVLFFYSDGINEAQNESGEFFGEIRLEEIIKKNKSLHPRELIEKIHAEIVSFVQATKFSDDLTCIAVKILE